MKKSLLVLSVFFSLPAFAVSPDPNELLKASDRARGGLLGGLTWDIQVSTTEDGTKSERGFSVKAKGSDALVEGTSPARNKNEKILFNDRVMWFVKPGLKKPVSISARQKLSGQAANGDIASTQYSRDYEITAFQVEKMDNSEVMRLDLKAKSKSVTYDQITYWIELKTKQAKQADFLTFQGKVFKKAKFEYKNEVKVDGQELPFVSKMMINDAEFPDNFSVITYSNPKPESHPASIFNINNIAR